MNYVILIIQKAIVNLPYKNNIIKNDKNIYT